MTGDHLQELRDQGKVRPRLDWRWLVWLVWLVVAFVAAAAATYGLLHVGMLRLP